MNAELSAARAELAEVSLEASLDHGSFTGAGTCLPLTLRALSVMTEFEPDWHFQSFNHISLDFGECHVVFY